MIAHEALHILKQHPVWECRLREMLSDALYTGTLPAAVEKGLTVLLPKETQPRGWGETRPITLSSTVLKAIAQLLLRRCAYTLAPLNALQWAAPRQARHRTHTHAAESGEDGQRLGGTLLDCEAGPPEGV